MMLKHQGLVWDPWWDTVKATFLTWPSAGSGCLSWYLSFRACALILGQRIWPSFKALLNIASSSCRETEWIFSTTRTCCITNAHDNRTLPKLGFIIFYSFLLDFIICSFIYCHHFLHNDLLFVCLFFPLNYQVKLSTVVYLYNFFWWADLLYIICFCNFSCRCCCIYLFLKVLVASVQQ